MIYFLFIFAVWTALCFTWAQRIEEVGNFVRAKIDLVAKLSKEAGEQGLEWEWRHAEIDRLLDKRKYAEMVLKFWRPLESFIKDPNCFK